MQTLILSILIAFSTVASAAPSCKLPKAKIIGLDYHTARAMLINEWHVPCIDTTIPRAFAGAVGYFEISPGVTSPRTRFDYPAFTVIAMCDPDIDAPNSCTVLKAQCADNISDRLQGCPHF